MKSVAFIGAVCLLVSAVSQGQVDFIYTNSSDTLGAYPDSIMVFTAGGVDRPLARENGARTGSVVSRPVYVDIAGTPYLYWYDNIVDSVVRATDGNLNGVLDPVEMETLWDFTTVPGATISSFSPDSFRYENGRVLLSNDGSPVNGATGIWELTDLNSDGDYFDLGETVRILDGTLVTVPVGAATGSIDDIESADYLPNGDVIFYEDDDTTIFRLNPVTGVVTSYLNYRPQNPALPLNPDFGTVLPAATGDFDLVVVDPSTTPETVYMAVNFFQAQRYIFRGQDLNGNGDLNDAGEVVLFYDGNTAPVLTGAIDDISLLNGRLYGSGEDGTGAGFFYELTDLNMDGDALDAGEQVILGTLPSTNDPTMLGLTAVPAGIFGIPSCALACIDQVNVPSIGATVVFNFTEIPTAAQGVAFGFVAASSTPGGSTPIAPGCVGGLTIDTLTMFQLNDPGVFAAFSTATITGSTASTAGFPVPALPPGTTFYYAGVVIGAPQTYVTQTRQVVVQ